MVRQAFHSVGGVADDMKPGNFGTIFTTFWRGREHMPFAWGSNDCATYPADLGVAAGLGDFLEGLRGYDSALGAASVLQGAGYADLKELADDRLDEVLDDDGEPNKAFAQTGDIALIEVPEQSGLFRFTYAVFKADGGLMGPGPKGTDFRAKFDDRWPNLVGAYRLGRKAA